MKQLSAFLFMFCFAQTISAQKNVSEILFVDNGTLQPLNNVAIYVNGIEKGRSDSDGYIFIGDTNIVSAIAVRQEYASFTIKNIQNAGVIKMSKLSQSLGEIVVTNRLSEKISNDNREYVIDYELASENILLITQALRNRKNWLQLLRNDGKKICIKEISEYPVQLFKSCMDRLYILTSKHLFPVVATDTIILENPYQKELLMSLQECEDYYKDTYYYKIKNKQNFQVAFCYAKKEDTAIHPFIKLERRDMAKASEEEYWTIQQLLAFGDYEKAAHKARLRYLWDKNAFKVVDVPLIRIKDSFIVFDFDARKILHFDTHGILKKEIPMLFNIGKIVGITLLHDKASDIIYLYKKNLQLLEEVNIYTGKTEGNNIFLDKTTAENVKVRSGYVYYLWQDANNAATKQLYRQILK